MSGLPWVRLDANISTNVKIRRLLRQRNGHRAFTLYTFALGWSGGHGTDGYVPDDMVELLEGSQKLAELLASLRLWERADDEGWSIINFAERQELSAVTRMKHEKRVAASSYAICDRWMQEKPGRACTCGKHGQVTT
jgi:hypothetical protein